MSHFFRGTFPGRDNVDMTDGFEGRHSSTGTVADALAASGFLNPKTGKPYTESLILGASGGIAFGLFVFEYKGHLPHVSLLARNTFGPFERSLDNMAIRREVKETVKPEKGEQNLREGLEDGHPVIVLADQFSLPHSGLCGGDQMWYMRPLLVVGYEAPNYILADGSSKGIPIHEDLLMAARSKVKKDRFRVTILEAPDPARLPEGLIRGIETSTALFLDKPPAGSANNFGLQGLRHFAASLVDSKSAKGWPRQFEPGPRLVQALAGRHGQPGLWNWIEIWGTNASADRGTYADFLEEAVAWTGISRLAEIAPGFRRSAQAWSALAEASMPDSVPEFKELKALKRRHHQVWVDQGPESLEERARLRERMDELVDVLSKPETLAGQASAIREAMAHEVGQIEAIEGSAFEELRAVITAR